MGKGYDHGKGKSKSNGKSRRAENAMDRIRSIIQNELPGSEGTVAMAWCELETTRRGVDDADDYRIHEIIKWSSNKVRKGPPVLGTRGKTKLHDVVLVEEDGRYHFLFSGRKFRTPEGKFLTTKRSELAKAVARDMKRYGRHGYQQVSMFSMLMQQVHFEQKNFERGIESDMEEDLLLAGMRGEEPVPSKTKVLELLAGLSRAQGSVVIHAGAHLNSPTLGLLMARGIVDGEQAWDLLHEAEHRAGESHGHLGESARQHHVIILLEQFLLLTSGRQKNVAAE